jgi:hypothetical protein
MHLRATSSRYIFASHLRSTSLRYIVALHRCGTSLRHIVAAHRCGTSLRHIVAAHRCGTSLRHIVAAHRCSTSSRYIVALHSCTTSSRRNVAAQLASALCIYARRGCDMSVVARSCGAHYNAQRCAYARTLQLAPAFVVLYAARLIAFAPVQALNVAHKC